MAQNKEKQKLTGMGAVVHKDGVAFRVWAPNAGAVFVKGEFNNWSDTETPLSREENGCWYTDVTSARVGQGYKFLLVNGEQKLERIDPYARQVTNSVGYGIIYDPHAFNWQGDAYELPPFNELVIYEMHIGSFFADKAGKPGDFDTAMEKLGHLKRLGINAIQVMPVTEFAGDYSWGYNPAQIFAVESIYGGPDAFKMFVRKAHQQGFAVIQDVVYNHFGPSDLSLWQFDGWQENGKGGIYFYNDQRAETPWGSTRPDYGREEVRRYIRDNAMMWLDEYHVDGLRFDSTLYIRCINGDEGNDLPDGWKLMQEINYDLRSRSSHYISIAEDLRSNAWLTKSYTDNGAGFHSQWDANFVHPVRSVVVTAQDEHRSMDVIRNALLFNYDGDVFRRVVYSESHDEVANGKARVPQEITPEDPEGWYAQKRSTLAAGLVFTAPGIPMLFQGQEFLQGEWFRDDVPLDWDLNEEHHGIVRLYRDLVQLRLNRKGFSRGLCGQFINIYHVNEADNVLAFQRWDQHGAGDDVVVVMNFSHTPRENYDIGMPAPGLWKLRLNSDARIYSNDFQNFFSTDITAHEGGRDGLQAYGSLSIGPYSLLIYTLEAA
ncbi:MAG: alpha amylase C-terminal domain-containing protein [Anaerolineae bacterium]|nr:alpha amylase C-terminal domain-containing protein [Anaerolineae bacterium]